MARQTGDIVITGIIDDMTFYKMEGAYYVRMKSSLTGKRFWRDRAFDGSRRSCKRLGRGSALASKVYRSLPREERQYALFCLLKREAIALLKKGMGEEEVLSVLHGGIAGRIVAKKSRKRLKKKIACIKVFKACPSISIVPNFYKKTCKRSKVYSPV